MARAKQTAGAVYVARLAVVGCFDALVASAARLGLSKPLEHAVEVFLLEAVGLERDPPVVPGGLLLGILPIVLEFLLAAVRVRGRLRTRLRPRCMA